MGGGTKTGGSLANHWYAAPAMIVVRLNTCKCTNTLSGSRLLSQKNGITRFKRYYTCHFHNKVWSRVEEKKT